MVKSKKFYIYEIRLPEELTLEVKCSAASWGEQYDRHVARVLREGLKRLASIQKKHGDLEKVGNKEVKTQKEENT